MASIEKRTRNGQVRWYMRYRDPAGAQRTKTFDRKVDAERFLTTVESAKLKGSYIDPAASRLTVGIWAQSWLDCQTHLKPSTRERYAGILREHIDPRWGTTRLADISHSAVQTWVSEVAASRSSATARKVHRVLSLVLAMAVKDDRLMRNPAAGVSLPRVNAAERMYLSHEQVHELAEACGSHRLVVGRRAAGASNARAQVRDHDARPVWAPVPGPAGRGRRPSGRRGSRCCVPVVYPGRHHPDVGELRNDQSPRKPGDWRCSPDGIRTRATALRGRRPRPLDDGAVLGQKC